ncbi:MAG: DUF2339 domain-containing protein [Bauldia sp.]
MEIRPILADARFGTRWTVWVGGLALALGGVFLVQYSIEQGLLGPGVRVFLGALLAAILIAAGEWTRRKELTTGLAGLPSAHVPSILTAAGTVVAFATVFVAYAFYGFLGSGAAFILLALVALATLAAALIHGPALAGLGMVSGYVTPLLVSSDVPDYWALTLYLIVLTAASLALASARRWLWLAVAAIVLDVAWSLLIAAEPEAFLWAPMANAIAGFVLVAAFVVAGLLFGPDAAPGKVDGVSSGALMAYVALAGVVVVSRGHDGGMLFAFTLLVAATIAIAWRTEAATAAAPGAAIVSVLVIAGWAFAFDLPSGLRSGGPGVGPTLDPRLSWNGAALGFGALLAALFAGSGFAAQGRSERPQPALLWAASAAATPPAILAAIYYRLADMERSLPLALVALVIAGLFAAATDRLARGPARPGTAAATAIFATGSVVSLALALTFALERAWLSVGFALMAAGIAYVFEKRRLAVLPWLAAGAAVLAILRALWEAPFVTGVVWSGVIFNWLVVAYGIPAVALWLCGWLLRRRSSQVPSAIADGAAILFTAAFVFLEIHHFMQGGTLSDMRVGFAELCVLVVAGLALTIALELVWQRTRSVAHDIGGLAVGGLTLAAIGRLAVLENPWLWSVDVGGPIFNLILIGYGIPALLLAILGLTTREARPPWYRWIVSVTTVAVALLYLTLETRRLFHGPEMATGPVFDAEQYSYSAVWLAFGVIVLLAGVLLRSQPVRLASAAVIVLTIAKVFLVDLAGLTGVFRALSFIVLGLVLVAIGWLYQRLLFPRPPAAPKPPSAPATAP